MNGIGISGSDGVGKEKLAAIYAEEAGYDLLSFDSERIFEKTRKRFTLNGQLDEYGIILSRLESSYMNAKGRFITDLTPIDVVAMMYSLFAWHQGVTLENEKKVDVAWKYAAKICSQYLNVIMHIQPNSGTARQENLNAISTGLIHTRLVYEVNTSMFTLVRGLNQSKQLHTLKEFIHTGWSEETPYNILSSSHH